MFFFPGRKARRLLALALACCASTSQAQQRITAEEAVALALSRPHVQQALDAGVASARSEVLAARTWPNPELAFQTERGDSGPLGAARETTVVLSQEIELGGRRGLQRAAAEAGVLTAQAEAAYQRAHLRTEVSRAYAAVVAAEHRERAHSRTANGLDGIADVAAKRFGAGDLSGYDSRRIAQASAQARARAAQADAEAIAARARLAGWIGDVALTAELEAVPPLPEIPVPTDETTSAELALLEARLVQARNHARAEGRIAVPVTVGLGTKRVDEAGVSDSMAVLEVAVPLPLFDRNQAGQARAAAELRLAEAEYRRALVHARARRAAALEAARRLSVSARQLLDAAVPEATRLTEIARASFAEGELDLVGLLDAHEAETGIIDQALEQHARALDALLELQLLFPSRTPPTDPSN